MRYPEAVTSVATEPNANAIRDIENMIIYDSLGLSPRRIVHIRHGVEVDELLHRYRPPHAASVSVATLPRFRAPICKNTGPPETAFASLRMWQKAKIKIGAAAWCMIVTELLLKRSDIKTR